MSPVRLILFGIFAIISVIWAAQAMYGHTVRLEHRDLIADIRIGEKLPEQTALNEAITD